MNWVITQQKILTNLMLLCLLFSASIAQAMSLSMMLMSDMQANMSVSAVHVMPCHQDQADTQSDQNKQRATGCVHCQLCALANLQAIQTTLLNTVFHWPSDDYHRMQFPIPHSQDYPPAIRPPIV